MYQFHDVQQCSEEWYLLRAGKLTSSNLASVMANFGKAFGEPAKKLAVDIAIERITGEPSENGYSNDHMERGIEQEPIARALYEQESFCDVTNGGFFDLGFFGLSPDGLVGDNGVIEIKSAIPSVHFSRVKRQGLDPQYKWQCIANLMFTERSWLDFISYCPFFPEDGRLFIYRIRPDDVTEEFKQIVARVEEFRGLVDQYQTLILNGNYRITA